MKKNEEIKNETMETVVEDVKDVTNEETQNETVKKENMFTKARSFYDKHSTAFKVAGAFVVGLVVSYAVNRNSSDNGDEEGNFDVIIDLPPADYDAVEVKEDSYLGYEAE